MVVVQCVTLRENTPWHCHCATIMHHTMTWVITLHLLIVSTVTQSWVLLSLDEVDFRMQTKSVRKLTSGLKKTVSQQSEMIQTKEWKSNNANKSQQATNSQIQCYTRWDWPTHACHAPKCRLHNVMSSLTAWNWWWSLLCLCYRRRSQLCLSVENIWTHLQPSPQSILLGQPRQSVWIIQSSCSK